MGNKKKSKKELIEEMKALLLRVEELEAVERKYHVLSEKIQRLAGQMVEQDAPDLAIEVPREADRATNG
jgi:hypothetical protein